MSLYDLTIDSGGPFGSSTDGPDITYVPCGETLPQLKAENGAVMSADDIRSTASYQDCTQAVKLDQSDSVVPHAGRTFCILQSPNYVKTFGGQVIARVTVLSADANYVLHLSIERWRVG